MLTSSLPPPHCPQEEENPLRPLRKSPPSQTARRVGRPPKEENKDKINVTLRLRRAFYTNLKRLARKEGRSAGEMVTIAVIRYTEQITGPNPPQQQPRTQAAATGNR